MPKLDKINIINPLSDITGFSSLTEYFEKNKDKNWKEWLSFDQVFENPGKQGLVGLLKPMDEILCPNKKPLKIVFKISQYINYLVQHEYTVMKGLNQISPYCPHFCKAIGTLLCEVNPSTRKKGNPFEITTKHPIEKEILLSEYVDNSSKLYNYIRSDKIHEDVIYSAIKQVLMGLAIAQKKKKFTHYDLHSYNIMMKKCNKDVVFLYILDDDNQFCVPTMGHYPVIIDFGFSYIDDLEDGPAWPSMAHTDVGFMSDRFDPISDPKLFLVTVAREMRQMRKNKKSNKFRTIVKNMFGRLKIDWKSGWDNVEKKGASEFVTEMLSGHSSRSNIFDNYEHYCIDIVQSLIILPMEEQNYENINKSYKAFLDEFVKIEKEIGDPFYNLYILKGIVDVAREVRIDYLQKGEYRINAVKYFKKSIYERIRCVANYCKPKNINFEKMLCALLCLARNIEGILYDVINSRMTEKNEEYKKIPLQTPEQLYGALEINIKDKYKFNKNTTVFVMDCVSEKCSRLEISDVYKQINKIPSLSRGSFMYDIYKK
jgi:hypothetical protein